MFRYNFMYKMFSKSLYINNTGSNIFHTNNKSTQLGILGVNSSDRSMPWPLATMQTYLYFFVDLALNRKLY